jgi:hypothetical protein
MAIPMGLDKIGQKDIVFKRKFRWTFALDVCQGKKVPEFFVKLAARPNISIEEVEINHLNGKMWIPGKATWETITVTYYDIAGVNDGTNLLSWLATVYDFTNPETLKMGKSRGVYSGEATLKLFDGCGNEVEAWTMRDVWPQAINFGDLDYSSSEDVNIELTLRYSQVSVKFANGAVTPCAC